MRLPFVISWHSAGMRCVVIGRGDRGAKRTWLERAGSTTEDAEAISCRSAGVPAGDDRAARDPDWLAHPTPAYGRVTGAR